MKKYICLLGTIISFILLPNIIYANCPEEVANHYREIKDEYTVEYEFNTETEDYTLNFYNPEPFNYEYAMMNFDKYNCEHTTDKDYVCHNVPAGSAVVKIYTKDDSCDEPLEVITLELEKANNFSKDELCEGIEEFVLCQPTYDKEITYEEFVSRIKIYKKTKAKKETEEVTDNTSDNFINKIISYVKDKLFIIIIAIIFIVAVTITVILMAKSIRKSRRLE